MMLDATGTSARGQSDAVTTATIYEAASLSKVAFAYIVLKMAERGEIDLDAPLHTLSKKGFGPPALRNTDEYYQLTARMILSHQSGLPNWFTSDVGEKYLQSPGTSFHYSGVAFCLLNEVVEEVTGKTLERLAQTEFKTIGMHNSSFFQPETGKTTQANLASGHDAKGVPDEKSHFPKQSETDNSGQPYHENPAASLFTTAEDFAKLMKACVSDEFIRKNMFKPAINLKGNDAKAVTSGVSDNSLENLSWGLGIGIQRCDNDSIIVFHWGDSETFRNFAAVRLNPDQSHQAIVCLTNSANGSMVFRQVAEPIVGDLTPTLEWLSRREQLAIQATPPAKLISTKVTPAPPDSVSNLTSTGATKNSDASHTDNQQMQNAPTTKR